MDKYINTHIVVIGSGPSGYTASIKCANIGYKVVLIEKYLNLGGTCLNVGCIPSKYLLYISKVINLNKYLYKKGIFINKNKFNLHKIKLKKDKIINLISGNLFKLVNRHNILLLNGISNFLTPESIEVFDGKKRYIINFNYAIIASGSVNNFKDFNILYNYRVWDSTDALNLNFIPEKFLIVGCGFIGLEIATIYNFLGSRKIDIIDCCSKYLTFLDKDIFDIYSNYLKDKFNFKLSYKLLDIKLVNDNLYVYMNNCINNKLENKRYDAVLISTGRSPNINFNNLVDVGINLNNNNFIKVNDFFQTSRLNIFAIGDVIGHPMLAHKGIYQAKNVIDIISGNFYNFRFNNIPKIIYTDPEISWVGINEIEAKKNKIDFRSVVIPWKYCGKALINNCNVGVTKLIFNRNDNKIIGAFVVGNGGSELLGELSLAIEMGCDAEDLSLILHAHPTLYETISEASDVYLRNYYFGN